MTLLATGTGACGRSDAAVQGELRRQLAEDPVTRDARLDAVVNDGVARISGETDSRAQQSRAVDIANAIKGITRIEPAMRLNDAALLRAVKDAISSDASVAGVPVTVEVRQGDVRLVSDRTNADERARLVEIARGVEGVTHVEDQMK